ncbi:MAG TPA: hypothetical protein VM910_34685 [Bradyrhizobium sp.]|jgi:hypothetical protein|nr:hypothetical protein [Bradyrhizobium sp.]
MSYTVNGILGVVAVVATFGAVQFASGHDLTVGMRSSDTPLQEEVNRTVKADRAAVVAAMPAQARTISIRLERLPNTSIVVRLPAAREARSTGPALFIKSGERAAAIACEPMVSVLTEVVRQLQPGRCVT